MRSSQFLLRLGEFVFWRLVILVSLLAFKLTLFDGNFRMVLFRFFEDVGQCIFSVFGFVVFEVDLVLVSFLLSFFFVQILTHGLFALAHFSLILLGILVVDLIHILIDVELFDDFQRLLWLTLLNHLGRGIGTKEKDQGGL